MIDFLIWKSDKNKNPNNKKPKIPGKSRVNFRKDQLKKSPRQVFQGRSRSGHYHGRCLKTFLLDYDNVS